MARHTIPQVIDDGLIPFESAYKSLPSIEVGSEEWYAWLTEPTTRSFAFRSPQGTLTARREYSHGNWYWYAYRSQDGHLHKTYLGKSKELTLERLLEAARFLSPEKTIHPRWTSSLRSAHLPAVATPSSGTSLSPLPLLTTKLALPSVRSNFVLRPRLIHQMNVAILGPLTLIAAPAGWGKTTLLHAWYTDASRSAWPFAWVSLDAGDNDPIRFWTYVVATLNSLHLGVGETPLELLYASPPSPIEAVLTCLLNGLNQLPIQTVLVLDDYHLVETQPIHDALTYLVEHLPANVHLVLASRSDPHLPLARLRTRGVLTELRSASLRFTFEETTAFLREVMGLSLSAEQVATLQARTEGWIAGLQLAALSLQGRDDVASFIDAFTGSHRYVVDYLVEEVLLRQPATVQAFLVQTCILGRLCASLCDAVRGRDDSQELLAQVERSHLFLVSLDDERQWYRYHHLFAEVLHSRLRQTQPALIPELHRQASDWFGQRQLFDEAITHALAIPDVEHAANLIEQYGLSTNFLSQFQTLLGWLNRLPEALFRTHPVLCVTHAVMLTITHQLEPALARIQDAERCLEQEMAADQRRISLSLIAIFRSFLARLIGDYERSVPLAQQALELLPESQEMLLTSVYRPSMLVTVACAYLVDGDLTTATERFVVATVMPMHGLGSLPITMRSISNLARLQLLQGRLRQAASTIEQVMRLGFGHGGLPTLLNGPEYYFIMGELLYEWNQLQRAQQHLEQGMDLVRDALTAEAEMITRGYLTFARLQQACGRSVQALDTLNAFSLMSQQRGFAPALLARGAAVQARMELAQGNLATAIRWVETSGVSAGDDLSYLHEQHYLTLARVRIAQGQEQPTGLFLSEALGLLERLGQDAEAKNRMRSLLEVLLLRTLALQQQGDQAGALTLLERALALAQPEGYIRIFLDEGAPMITLLYQAYAQHIMPEYVATLLEAAGERATTDFHSSLPRSSPLLAALTIREQEVLRLLMDGASNSEIASRLVLSVNTVKKHVLHICRKLGVRSRTQAIAQARSLDLLLLPHLGKRS